MHHSYSQQKQNAQLFETQCIGYIGHITLAEQLGRKLYGMYQVGDLRSAFRTKGASPYLHARVRYIRVFYDVYHAGNTVRGVTVFPMEFCKTRELGPGDRIP